MTQLQIYFKNRDLREIILPHMVMQILHTFLWQYGLLFEFQQHYPLIKMFSPNYKDTEMKIYVNIEDTHSFLPMTIVKKIF